MDHNMILSASGWRKVFSLSGDEQDKKGEISKESKAIAVASADCFFNYLSQLTGKKNPVIAVGFDTRPTGPAITDAILRTLLLKGAFVKFTGVSAAPEIMAYSKSLDGFIYISASHNPIGHNGIKFGTNDGGVLNAQENAKVVDSFLKLLAEDEKLNNLVQEAENCNIDKLKQLYDNEKAVKKEALTAYRNFVKRTISGSEDSVVQDKFFSTLKEGQKKLNIGVYAFFNGSARGKCIDVDFFAENEIKFNHTAQYEIISEIIPEGENLQNAADGMTKLHLSNEAKPVIGYMPDCDGDRGNIVYWDSYKNEAVVLKAQEVFSLSVLAELTYDIWQNADKPDYKPAIAVNCPTSMRIEEIANALGADVFRAEVGEANVVNLAREKRAEGYSVPILGEGSNGGTITYPSSVRDPLNTVFALLKLLLIRENGLFEMWCKKSDNKYNPDYTLADIIKTLPEYTTTGVSEPRAILKVKNLDHTVLKAKFQKEFEKSWNEKKDELKSKYGIYSYEAIITNGTKETRNVTDFSLSKKGGLKVLFSDENKNPLAYIWMRGSGTEPVFRVMCDVKGCNPEEEKALLSWETELIKKADA